MDYDEETSDEYDKGHLYINDPVITPMGEGKVVEFKKSQKSVKVWVRNLNQYQWFDREEIAQL